MQPNADRLTLSRSCSLSFSDGFTLFVTHARADAKYSWFWVWVNANCVDTMNEATCERCDDFSLTNCQADEVACYSNVYSDTCAYDLCREGVLSYIIELVE